MAEKAATPEVKDIYTAINAVMSEVGYVQKESTRTLNYTFAGEAALIRALRPAMVTHGITMSVVHLDDAIREQYTTNRGTQMTNTLIKGTVRFTHAPSGTHVDVQAYGEGSDAGDKSANKAATGLYKYALRQTFVIETGDDPDKDSSDNQERAAGTTTKKGGKKNSKTEEKPAHTQKELADYAQTLGMAMADIRPVLEAAGIAEFDPAKFDEMKKTLQTHVEKNGAAA
jgi:hypothetical protein